MNEDVEGLNIYVLDSFDNMATLLSKEATVVATKIPEFNKNKLRKLLREASDEDEFAEIFIPLVDAKHDMYNLQEFSEGLGIKMVPRDPAFHPTWNDYEVRKMDIKPIQIEPGSFAVICKSATGCDWSVEWWFIEIVPKELPKIKKDFYEETFLRPWDEIRRSLIVDEKHGGSLPRETFEHLIDCAYEMGYNKALGKKD